MGNPHAVVFMDGLIPGSDAYRAAVRHHPLFPRRTNTEFVEVLSRHKLRMRVWERGAGKRWRAAPALARWPLPQCWREQAERSVDIECAAAPCISAGMPVPITCS